MAMSDPIADLLTRIRNGLTVKHDRVRIPASRMKEEICALLKREGFIEDYELIEDAKQNQLDVTLRYDETRGPVIQAMRRVSKPSLRVYKKSKDLRPVRSGQGSAIVSTSKGIMTGKQARSEHLGGEVLCEVW